MYHVKESIRHGYVPVYYVFCYGADGVASLAFNGEVFWSHAKALYACEQLNKSLRRLLQ
jgi:hypothetical protein